MNEKRGRDHGFPGYRKKYVNDSIKFPQHIKLDNNHVLLPKIGWVRFIKSREIEGTIKQAVVKRQNNHWYVNLTCQIEKEVPEVEIRESHVIGLDVGLLTFATLSSGELIPNPKFLKTQLSKVKYLQKQFSKTKKGSKNRLCDTKRYSELLHEKEYDVIYCSANSTLPRWAHGATCRSKALGTMQPRESEYRPVRKGVDC